MVQVLGFILLGRMPNARNGTGPSPCRLSIRRGPIIKAKSGAPLCSRPRPAATGPLPDAEKSRSLFELAAPGVDNELGGRAVVHDRDFVNHPAVALFEAGGDGFSGTS